MTHHIPAHHFITDLRTSIERFILDGFTRSSTMLRAAFRNRSEVDLSPHLRYDSGEDDMRPQVPQTLLQQEATLANSLDTILLRSF